MRWGKRFDKTIFLLLFFLLVVLGLFGYLVRVDKEISAYNMIHNDVIALKLIDRSFDNFALDINTFKHYASVNEDLEKFFAIFTGLKTGIRQDFGDNSALEKLLSNAEKSFQSKADDLEYFKSQNSTLINTSHFLFDLQETIREESHISAAEKSMVNETLFYLLKFVSSEYIDKRVVLKRLEDMHAAPDFESEETIYNFYTHARLMLQTLDSVKAVAHDIQTSPLYSILDQIQYTLDKIYNDNLDTNRLITFLFFVNAIVLIMLLVRDHLKAVQINEELYAFQFAVKHSDNTIVLTDSQRQITFVNAAFERTTGYTFNEALGKNPNILKSGKQNETFYIEMNRKLDHGEKWEGEFINKRKDGSLYYEKASIVPIFLHDELISFLAIKLDITDYVEQNQKLKQAATVFENTEEAIIITDERQRVISVNNAFTKMYGYTLDALTNRRMNFLQSGKQSKSFYAQMWETIESKEIWSGKIINKSKNGTLIPVWNTIKKIKDDEGKTVNYIAVQTDLRAWEGSLKKIDYLAYHDQLTGLYNRTNFEEYLAQALKQARRNKEQLAVLFIDLDRFKIINDTLGHDIGDALLIEIASRLKSVLRESDFIARWGGDEFVIVLENLIASSDTARVAEHILMTVGKPIKVNNYSLTTSASIGIAMYPDNGDDFNTLIKHADSAMYDAKEHGKNRYRYYTAALSQEVENRLSIDSALRTALDNHEFYLLFQPQYSLHTRQVLSVEALIRWKSETLGHIMPDVFIPIAEEDGHIVEIGYFVFEASCKALRTMRNAGLQLEHIAINVATTQFKERDLLQRFLDIVDQYALVPSDIVLEITERIAMEPTHGNREMLSLFQRYGFGISIDDFGTGYSSMSYLKDLPVDTIKIDRSFVNGIGEQSSSDSVAEAIIVLARTMNFTLIAEGIETEEQERFLLEKGCELGQGYLFSKPIEIEALIRHFS